MKSETGEAYRSASDGVLELKEVNSMPDPSPEAISS